MVRMLKNNNNNNKKKNLLGTKSSIFHSPFSFCTTVSNLLSLPHSLNHFPLSPTLSTSVSWRQWKSAHLNFFCFLISIKLLISISMPFSLAFFFFLEMKEVSLLHSNFSNDVMCLLGTSQRICFLN